MDKKLTLNKQNQKDLTDYCKLNDIEDIDKCFQQCFKQGFDIKKYGLIGENNERVIEYIEKEVSFEVIKYVEKETIREVPIEVIKEVEKIVVVEKEVPVEKIVEKTIEVPIEIIKEVEKPNEKMGMLQETLMKLRKEMGEKNKTIEELSDKISQLEKLVSNTGAVYMKGSNISKNL
jgi:hypothetical protein